MSETLQQRLVACVSRIGVDNIMKLTSVSLLMDAAVDAATALDAKDAEIERMRREPENRDTPDDRMLEEIQALVDTLAERDAEIQKLVRRVFGRGAEIQRLRAKLDEAMARKEPDHG